MLLPIEKVLSDKEVSEYSACLSQLSWLSGKKTAGSVASQVKQNFQLDDSMPEARQLRLHLLQRLNQHPLFVSAVLPAKIYPPKFNCYQDGGYYGDHIDSAIMRLEDGSALRTDVSVTLFLSEPDSYTGGELSMETPFGVQEIKLNAGDMIVYPSTTLHHVKPVTHGQRVCAFFWVQSMIRQSERREQLFELDQAIQRLRINSDNAQQVQTLTGLYHNLLREWAETA